MKVMIATPCANGVMEQNYVRTVFRVGKALSDRGVDHHLNTLSTSDIVWSRNLIASQALADQSVSHLLFIDSDMSFRPELVLRMLDFGEPLVGLVYPKRELDLKRLLRDLRPEDTATDEALDRAIFRNMDYIVRPVGSGGKYTFDVRNGFARVRSIGMGACLIDRIVLDRMVSQGIAPKHTQNLHPRGPDASAVVPHYGFFDRVGDETASALSEDYSFCQRWTEGCGGQVWACIDELVGHHGTFGFRGRYRDKMDARRV